MNLPLLSGNTFHPSLGLVSYHIQEVPDDPDEQVAQVIGMMRGYANQDSRDPSLIEDAGRAYRSDDPVSDTWEYLRRGGVRGMQFVRDEVTALPFAQFEQSPGGWRPFVESIARPELLAQCAAPQGDCDCFATYGAAHLMTRGVRCAFATVAADDIDPRIFSHVYLVAYPNVGPFAGMRIPMDLSHGPELGWEVANRFGKFCEWPLDGGGLMPWFLAAAGAYLLYRGLN
jgi:hypothetical protein